MSKKAKDSKFYKLLDKFSKKRNSSLQDSLDFITALLWLRKADFTNKTKLISLMAEELEYRLK